LAAGPVRRGQARIELRAELAMEIDARACRQDQVERSLLLDLGANAGHIVGVVECWKGVRPEAVLLESNPADS
tara:strand:+ start:133 stop:351 length:219 start_codon:yes stop_codon:yes gene_type:complete